MSEAGSDFLQISLTRVRRLAGVYREKGSDCNVTCSFNISIICIAVGLEKVLKERLCSGANNISVLGLVYFTNITVYILYVATYRAVETLSI